MNELKKLNERKEIKELKEKNLRPGRKITDQFIIASALSLLIVIVASLIPMGWVVGPFEVLLGGNHDAAVFLKEYFGFIGIWICFILVACLFKGNRPMLNAAKYRSPRLMKDSDGTVSLNGNRAGNNIVGLLIGLALGFGCNGFCILMSSLLGNIHLEYSGFKPIPFIAFFICVFIQSAAEEIADRWYLYQKLRRRYKAPWIAIVVNSLVFTGIHVFNPGMGILPVIQIFTVGTIFSMLVYYYNGLWVASAFHAAWNFTQSIIFGLPNSGQVSAYSVFRLDVASATNGLFYNVNFGVEGSIGAVVMLIALAVLIFLKNRGKGEHTDVWAENDRAALEKAAAVQNGIEH